MKKKFGVGIDMVEIKRFEDKAYQKNKKIILERAREWNKRNKEARKLIIEREKKSKLKSFWEVNLRKPK